MKRVGFIITGVIAICGIVAAFAVFQNVSFRPTERSGGIYSLGVIKLGSLGFARDDTKDLDSSEPFPPQFRSAELFTHVFDNAVAVVPQNGVTGIVVPHHLLAADVLAQTFALARTGTYDTVIIMSPDHFHAGKKNISVAGKDFSTVFGSLTTNRQIVSAITSNNPNALTQDFFYREHGIGGITPFVKHYFPSAKIVALTLKTGMPVAELDDLITRLKPFINEHVLIVQSTDFSHYLPATVAAQRDEETMRVIKEGEPKDFFSLKEPSHIDSRAAAYVQWSLQQIAYGARPEIFIHKNSQEYTQKFVDSTTSYIAQLYRARGAVQESQVHAGSLLFVGDVMLGRSVERLMKRHGATYPFDDIVSFFKTYPTVVANLEGPIVSPHTPTPDFNLHFSFDQSVSPVLHENGVTHVSLGNNHTFDGGQKGLDQTRTFLNEAQVIPFGDPKRLTEEDSATYDAKTNTILLSIHATKVMPSSQEVENLVAALRTSHQDAFLVAFMHWGAEYSLGVTPFQEKLGHLLLDAGVDCVIGAHPHVIEPVEIYNGKPIFYSLGNFIFDQYQSKDTQEGLMLAVARHESKVDYTIIPITIDRSKPRVMDEKSAQELLWKLQKKSGEVFGVNAAVLDIVGTQARFSLSQ